MGAKSGTKEIIVEELEKDDLSKNKIFEIVIGRTKLKPDRPERTINKYLYELLDEGIIAVVGFDLDLIDGMVGEMVRKGNINRVNELGMVFSLIDIGPIPLTSLINSVLNNLKRANVDYNKLRSIFTKKTKELEDESIREWNTNLKVVKNRKLDFHEMLWIEVILDINNQIKDKPSYTLITPSNKEIKQYLENNKEIYREKAQDITEKYENKLLWYLKDEKPDILQVKAIKTFVDNHILDIGQMTEEDFLIKTGLYQKKPYSKSKTEINDSFEQIMLYLYSLPEKEKNNLIYRLAYSLGPGKISTTRFRNFTEEILKTNKTYMDEVLDIIKRINSG